MKQFLSFSKWPPALIFASLMIFTSCEKNNTNSVNDPDSPAMMESVQGDADASDQFDDVFNITMGVQASDAGEDVGLGTGSGILYRPMGAEGTLSPDSTSRCYTVKMVPKIAHEFPRTITIDFGDGCLGKDGKLRKGKIVSIFTGPMFVPGSKTSTTFIDYEVDSFKVEGTHTVENTSSSNKKAWTVKVINGKITNTQTGFWKKWDGIREHKQTEGNGTPLYLLDDVFEITGNATGSNSNGNAWTSVITTPLIRKVGCLWRTKGQVTISRNSNARTAVLDYGDGACDNKATVTINGVVHNIILH